VSIPPIISFSFFSAELIFIGQSPFRQRDGPPLYKMFLCQINDVILGLPIFFSIVGWELNNEEKSSID
jgi:hypothetical protein